MDKIVYIPTFVLSAVIVFFYLIKCNKNKRKIELQTIINLILNSSGVVCAIFLIASTFSNELKKLVESITLYIFIGGVAVGFVSVQGIYMDIKNE